MTYFGELCRAMDWLGQQDRIVFFGQGVGNVGTGLSKSFERVPQDKLVELPVAEELQTGLCIGASLNGFIPICIFPRWNFVLRAADQIVNHLDRLPIYSGRRLPPEGHRQHLDRRTPTPSIPGPQHDGDFTEAFRLMLRTVRVVTLESIDAIVPAYRQAYDSAGSTILVELTHAYRDARGQWPKKESS